MAYTVVLRSIVLGDTSARKSFKTNSLETMSDKNKADHWQSLASEIGAEVPPEAATPSAPELPPAEAGGELPARRAKADRAPKSARPPRRRANWMELAEQLGVAPSESQEPAPTDAATEPLAAEEPPIWPSASPEPQDWLMQEPLIDTFEGSPAAETARGETHASGDRQGRDESERPSHRRKKRRRRGRESRTADAPSERVSPTESPDAGTVEEAAETPEEGASSSSTPDAPSRETPGRRTSRRRRRGRGDRRRSAAESAVSGESSEAVPDDVLAQGPAIADEDVDREEDERSTLDEDDERSSTDGGFAHRGIPSWEEAVGVVIAANLESRSKRGAGDASSRPRGGRGRGGRDRGGRDRGPRRARPS